MTVLAARRGVEHLLQALVHHVAVALEREHERVRAACASRRSRPTARGRAAPARGRRRSCPRTTCSSRCPRRAIACSTWSRSSIVSRNCRTASGSPQPGHMWCSSVSSRSGFFGSMRPRVERRGRRVEHRPVASSRLLLLVRLQRVGVLLVAGDRRHRLVAVQARGCVRGSLRRRAAGPTPKPEWSVETPPMNATGHLPGHADAHVVDHLARAQLERRRRGAPSTRSRRAPSRTGTATA